MASLTIAMLLGMFGVVGGGQSASAATSGYWATDNCYYTYNGYQWVTSLCYFNGNYHTYVGSGIQLYDERIYGHTLWKKETTTYIYHWSTQAKRYILAYNRTTGVFWYHDGWQWLKWDVVKANHGAQTSQIICSTSPLC